MTTIAQSPPPENSHPSAAGSLPKRLRPLHLGLALQGTMLWVPVEKLFMTQIGFTAASVGLVAAAYAIVTPVLEVPTGILADRWSRRGLLIVSAVALMTCSLVGGLSNNVPLYMVSALILGLHFATYSGTVESIVYDTVVEETGSSDAYPGGLCQRTGPATDGGTHSVVLCP